MIGIIGFKADAGYGSSVKYIEVKPNLALQKPLTIPTNYTGRLSSTPTPVQEAETKEKEQINKILEKDDLSNRDMVKLSRLMEKESKNSLPDSIKNNLELIDKTTHIIEKDANSKDSSYWAEIRPIPLSTIEKRSLRVSDSIKAASSLAVLKNDTIKSSEKKPKSKFLKTVKDIGNGHTWADTSGLSFTYGGLINLNSLSFNTVDGFVYGMNLRLSKSWDGGNSLTIAPDIRWAFSREQVMWRLNTNYRFNRMKRMELFFRTGISSTDIGNGGSINTFLNSITTLLMKENYLKLYESTYMTLGFRSEIANGLTMEISTGFEDRRVLQNTSSFSIINSNKSYSDNIPVNIYLAVGSNPINALSNQKHGDFTAKLTYIPKQRYRIRRGVKIPMGSDYPTFNLSWEHGINEINSPGSSYKQYDLLKFEASKNRSIGAFGNFRWRLRTGGFFDNTNISYYDFFHYNTQSLTVLINDYSDAFMLPAYYSLSTPEMYGEVHMKYTTPYLLIKLLPVLSNTLMRENISFSFLGSRFHKCYSEIGYSISEFLLLGEIGVYVGFDDLKYKSVGAKIVLRIN